MARRTETFTKSHSNWTFDSQAYTDDGKVWRWVETDRCCPLDSCESYGIPVDRAAQKLAQSQEIQAFVKEYRQQQEGVEPTAEEMYEMRAAFGQNEVVVNVLTGRKTQL
jgi:hypothetical protein